jgi:signal transduction histidine kinase
MQLAQRYLKRGLSNIDGLRSEQLQELLSQVINLLTLNLGNLEIQTRLIDELQDFSRAQVARFDFRMAACDLVALVRQVVLDQQVAHPQRVVFFETPGDTSIHVLADQQRLRQVVTNYLTNAFKYSPPERPVQVGITLVGASARVWVRDYGVGLSPEQQEQIWKPFYQVEDTPTHIRLPGLGLGLHICKVLIQRQQGKVGVESAPGEGSTFWFTLPLLQA